MPLEAVAVFHVRGRHTQGAWHGVSAFRALLVHSVGCLATGVKAKTTLLAQQQKPDVGIIDNLGVAGVRAGVQGYILSVLVWLGWVVRA